MNEELYQILKSSVDNTGLPVMNSNQFISVTDKFGKEEFRKTLSAQGVAVMKMDELMNYTTTWINELQANSVADEAHRQFGWANDKYDAFILGNKKVRPTDIDFNPPAGPTIALFPAFEPKGSLEGWKAAINFWNRDGFELYQYVTGIGFGSVLMEFANVNCSALHLHSKGTGVGKSTVMNAACSIWGNPENLVIRQVDTLHSKMNRGELYHSLPWCIDEVTNIPPNVASDLLYQFTDGMQRNRMSGNSNVERVRGRPWKLMAITTGNTSIVERVSMAKAMAKAEAQRVMECYVPDMKGHFQSKEETDTFNRALQENYGHAGIAFIQHVMQNLDEVRKLCLEIQKRVDKKAELAAENRFWSAQVSFTLAGLMIAKKIGVIDFDISKIFRWAMEVLIPQNKNNSSRSSSNKEQLKSDKRHSTKKNLDSDQKQIVSNSPKDQTKKRRPYNSRKQNSRRSSKQGVDDNRKKTYENKSRINIENSRNSEDRQNVQKDSGNVRRDNNSDSHKVNEVDGNRLDLPNND